MPTGFCSLAGGNGKGLMGSIAPPPPAIASPGITQALKNTSTRGGQGDFAQQIWILIYFLVSDLYFSFQKAGSVALPAAKEPEIPDASPSQAERLVEPPQLTAGPYTPAISTHIIRALQPRLALSEHPRFHDGRTQTPRAVGRRAGGRQAEPSTAARSPHRCTTSPWPPRCEAGGKQDQGRSSKRSPAATHGAAEQRPAALGTGR